MLFAFSGSTHDATLATHEKIDGRVLTYYWSDLEPAKNQFLWDIVEQDMKPWQDAGKGIILRFMTSGWKSWFPPYSAQGTPSFVHAEGVPFVKSQDGSLKPVYWHPHFLEEYKQFLLAAGARYDTRVDAVEMGIGDGGETKPDTRKQDSAKIWEKQGYSNQVWFTTIKSIVAYYKEAFPHTPLVLMPDNTFLVKGDNEEEVLSWAASQGIWLQNNGLVSGEVLKSAAWTQTVLLEESRNKGALQADIAQAEKNGAKYVLCFLEDLQAAGF